MIMIEICFPFKSTYINTVSQKYLFIEENKYIEENREVAVDDVDKPCLKPIVMENTAGIPLMAFLRDKKIIINIFPSRLVLARSLILS